MRVMLIITVVVFLAGCMPPTILMSPLAPVAPILPMLASCDTSAMPRPAPGAGPVAVPAGFNGGTLTGGSLTLQNPIHLDENGADLLIVVDGDLIVGADILFPQMMNTANAASLNITLVSLNGKVQIDPGIKVGTGTAASGASGNRNLAAMQGSAGGTIKVIAVNILLRGVLMGHVGGAGGDMIVNGGGNIFTNAANGGRGGDVVLCALETIVGDQLAGAVSAGTGSGGGGRGGNVSIDTVGTANGKAGDGGIAGDVHLIGTDPGGSPVQLTNTAVFMGWLGGEGGLAHVDAGFSSFNTNGFSAEAKGGWGGQGGAVLFLQAVHVFGKGRYASGHGGNGKEAFAYGNGGTDAAAIPPQGSGPGGNAYAWGGHGGPTGPTPMIPIPNKPPVRGVTGTPGSGGLAQSQSGTGGDGLFGGIFAGFVPASPSGLATAHGGKNGANQGPAVPNSAGPNPIVVGGRGGWSAFAIQAGQR